MSEVDVAAVKRWERSMSWNGSTTALRAIRDYLTHEFLADPARQLAHALMCTEQRYRPRHTAEENARSANAIRQAGR